MSAKRKSRGTAEPGWAQPQPFPRQREGFTSPLKCLMPKVISLLANSNKDLREAVKQKNVRTWLLFPLHSVWQESINPAFTLEKLLKMETNKIPNIFIIRATSWPGIPGVFLKGKGESLYLSGESIKNMTARFKNSLNRRQGFLWIL